MEEPVNDRQIAVGKRMTGAETGSCASHPQRGPAAISQTQHIFHPPVHQNKQGHSMPGLKDPLHQEEGSNEVPILKPVLLGNTMAMQTEESRTFQLKDGGSSVITVTDSGILQLWHAIGKWKQLTTDTDIARFLLSLYFNSKPSQLQSDSRCMQCNSSLILCCPACLFSTQTSSPLHSPASGKPPPQVISVCAQDVMDQSHSPVTSAFERDESPSGMSNVKSEDHAGISTSIENMGEDSSTVAGTGGKSCGNPGLSSALSKNSLIFQKSVSAQRQGKHQTSQKLRSSTRARILRHITTSGLLDQFQSKQGTAKKLHSSCKTSTKVSRKITASKSSSDQIQNKRHTLQRLRSAARERVFSQIDAPNSECSSDETQSIEMGKGGKKKRNSRLKIESIRSEDCVAENTDTSSSNLMFMEGRCYLEDPKEDIETENHIHASSHGSSSSENNPASLQIKTKSPCSGKNESQDSLPITQQNQKDKYPICDGIPFTNGKIPTFRHFTEYKCSKCGKAFNYKHLIRRHMQSPECECVVCGESFYDHGIAEIKRHMKTHKQVKVKQMSLCPICGKSIRGKKLAPHMKTHSEYRPYKCTMCNKSYKHKNGLLDHELKHKEKKFQCEICGEYFFRAAELERHKTFKHQQQVFECEECGKRLSLRKTLENHILTVHRKFRPYVCSFCGLSHTSQGSLKVHLRSHTGEKPYSCQHCPARFARLDYLKQHVRRHTGERPFACQDCGKSFSCRTRLTLHRKNAHSDRLFPCNLCREEFPLQSSLDFHRYNEHGGSHPLTIDQIPTATAEDSAADTETSKTDDAATKV